MFSPIESVAERLGMKVVHHKALCPFHADRTPSLAFNVRKNRFRCYACGAHGSAIDLTMKYLNKSYREALAWLGETCSPPHSPIKGEDPSYGAAAEPMFDPMRYARYFEHPWLSKEARQFLFKERKLDPKAVAWCRLTSWKDKQGTHWLQIPYYDLKGRLIGIQNRNLDYAPPIQGGREELSREELGSSVPRFVFPPGSQCSLYNLPIVNLLHEGDTLFLTEGPSDCWAMLSSGHKAIGIPSATLLKPSQLKKVMSQLPARVHLHMVPDNDEAGNRLYEQLKQHLPQLIRHQLPKGYKDYSQWYTEKSKFTM